MDKIKQQLNKLTSEVKGLKNENKELFGKIKELEKRIPPPLKIDPRPAEKMYDEVLKEVIKNRKVSTSYLQRKFVIGYAKASCLMDMLEDKGIIGPNKGAGPRDILIKK